MLCVASRMHINVTCVQCTAMPLAYLQGSLLHRRLTMDLSTADFSRLCLFHNPSIQVCCMSLTHVG